MILNGFTHTEDGWIIAPDGTRLRAIRGGGGQITGNKTLDAALVLAASAAAIYFTAGAATPAVAPAAGAALGGGAAAGVGMGTGAALTASELGAAGLMGGGAEAFAAGAPLATGAGVGMGAAPVGIGMNLAGVPIAAEGGFGSAAPAAGFQWSSMVPSSNQVLTGTMATNLGKQLFFPPTPKLSAPGPVLPSSGSTGRYTPVASAPAQQLAQLMAARRQASGQRRFA